MIILEGIRFRPTQEGWLLFLLQQSRPAAALSSPSPAPTSHALGGAAVHDGGGQPLESLGKLPGTYTWQWAALNLPDTPASHYPGSV